MPENFQNTSGKTPKENLSIHRLLSGEMVDMFRNNPRTSFIILLDDTVG